ncbi:MAG: hypothetical protein ABI905_07930 [Betaproteobacteria bacterium]
MQRKTINTILLMLGSAIAGIIIFVAVVNRFMGPDGKSSRAIGLFSKTEIVSEAPPIKSDEEGKYLGSVGQVDGRFVNRNNMLAAGKGRIDGNVSAGPIPVSGLRLRLALNEAVWSEWVVTDALGKYSISVPTGEYRINGYDLDPELVNKLLVGKIESPRNAISRDILKVSETVHGRGIDLDFVTPVVKVAPTGAVKVSAPELISWKPYPGASKYRLSLTEWNRPADYQSQRRLCDWSNCPSVVGTQIDLNAHGIKLTAGKYYSYDIDALDDLERAISRSQYGVGRTDFFAVE